MPQPHRRGAAVSATRATAFASSMANAGPFRSSLERTAVRSRRCDYPSASACSRPAMTRVEWRVLVADDEPAARRGVRQLLTPFPDFVIVGECRNGTEVLASLDSLRPHVLFLDIQMPGIDGFEVI